MGYETKIASLIVKPVNEPIFSKYATIVGIDDEAGGVYFTIEQEGGVNDKKLRFDPDEWPVICAAVERLIAEWG